MTWQIPSVELTSLFEGAELRLGRREPFLHCLARKFQE